MAVKSGFGVVLTHGELLDIMSLITDKTTLTNKAVRNVETPTVTKAPVTQTTCRKGGASIELDLAKELTKLGNVDHMDFYEFIQYLHVNQGYTYVTIAKAIGCTDTSICNWINKGQRMSPGMWRRISATDTRLTKMRVATKSSGRRPGKKNKKKEVTRRIKMDDASTTDVRYTLFNKAIKHKGTAELRISAALAEMSNCSDSVMAKVFNMSIERYKRFRNDESIKMPRALINMFKLYVHERTNEA
jgi:hypothetical protein